MKLESSFDEGASWVPVMDGLYTRIDVSREVGKKIR
jgi:hypothetical protein